MRKVSDRTFLHAPRRQAAVEPKVPLQNRDDLSRAYTPGVARVCLAIAENPEDARRLTIKRNTVAVVTDGSAVLGLGNIGPAAALPVMEGKAALFKQFAGVDAWPVCLDTQDTEEIIEIVKAIAPVYGGINLEDIAAPALLRDRARGCATSSTSPSSTTTSTAPRSWSSPPSPTRCGWSASRSATSRIVVSGVGAAGHAIIQLLHAAGRSATSSPATATARSTAARPTRDELPRGGSPRTPTATASPAPCTRRSSGPTSSSASRRPNLLDGDDIATDGRRSDRASPWPTPTRRSTRWRPAEHAAVVATGRSDFPNQINNVLAFPGLFRGLLDARRPDITDADAGGRRRGDRRLRQRRSELNASYIVPSVFDAARRPRRRARR